MDVAEQTQGKQFPTTQWSLVEQLRSGNEETALAALEHLLGRYYAPLQAFVVQKFNVSPEQASDWLHSFVWKRVMLQNLMASAKREEGKFRTFLATSLVNFIKDELRSARKKSRNPENGLVSLEEAPEAETIANRQGVTAAFDLAWGRGLLQEAFRRMQEECVRTQRPRLWQVFEVRLLNPILHGEKPIAYKELCERMNFRDETEAGNSLITAKRMFARLLRVVIREYAVNEEEVERELTELMAIFSAGNE